MCFTNQKLNYRCQENLNKYNSYVSIWCFISGYFALRLFSGALSYSDATSFYIISLWDLIPPCFSKFPFLSFFLPISKHIIFHFSLMLPSSLRLPPSYCLLIHLLCTTVAPTNYKVTPSVRLAVPVSSLYPPSPIFSANGKKKHSDFSYEDCKHDGSEGKVP